MNKAKIKMWAIKLNGKYFTGFEHSRKDAIARHVKAEYSLTKNNITEKRLSELEVSLWNRCKEKGRRCVQVEIKEL